MQKYHIALLSIAVFLAGSVAGFTFAPKQPPTPSMASMNHSMQGMMDNMQAGLEGKTGDDFDRAFIDEMVSHHQGAIDMATLVLKTSQRQQLRDLAQDIITAQTREIEMMKQWRTEWFGNR